jgi:hydroxyacyl-ACP dehydratase HTD2-like protein with hotdog domain
MERNKAVVVAFILKKKRSGCLPEQGFEPARQVWLGGNFTFMRILKIKQVGEGMKRILPGIKKTYCL